MEFKHGNITLIHGDCMEYMESMDWKADLAIVDPPYGINESSKAGNRPKIKVKYKISDWDKNAPNSDYFDLLKRKSKNQIIWGANHFIDNIPFNVSSPCWIVWDKVREGQDFADCELAWTSFKKAVKQFTFAWDGFRQGDMKNKENRFHPTQKPVALYKWILTNYAKKGDRIIDTHGGSMSIAIACYDLGFELVCIEKDKDYFNAAVKRFKQHIKQAEIKFPEQPEQPTQATLQL